MSCFYASEFCPTEIDHSGMATQQQKYFEQKEIDEMSAEEYSYFLSYFKLPTAFDL